MTIGEQIKTARKAEGLTQAQLAERIGVATGTIQQYERGIRQPRFEILEKIADELQISVLYFAGNSIFSDYEAAKADHIEALKERSIDGDLTSIIETMFGGYKLETVQGKFGSSTIQIYGGKDNSFSISSDNFYTICCAVQGLISGLVSALSVDVNTAINDEIEALNMSPEEISEAVNEANKRKMSGRAAARKEKNPLAGA